MTTPSTNTTVLRAALLGGSTAHSVSPQLHELLFPILRAKLDSKYESIEYSKVDLANEMEFREWVGGAYAAGFRGANVTNPYKFEAYSAASTHYGVARDIAVVNTLSFFENRTVAASTDGEGFLCALSRELAHFDLSRYHFITLGAGATAKSVLYSMLTRWMPLSFTLAGRSFQKAKELMDFVGSNHPGPTLKVCTIDELRKRPRPEEPCVVLNTTPLGQADNRENIFPDFDWQEDDIALDVIYNPVDTEFLKRAEEAGARHISGLGMLIEQAALSQYLWMSNELPDNSPLSLEEYFDVKAKLRALLTSQD
jgi:shikimate dehydrogenase